MLDKVKKNVQIWENSSHISMGKQSVNNFKQTYGYKSKLSSYCQENEFTKGIFQLV